MLQLEDRSSDHDVHNCGCIWQFSSQKTAAAGPVYFLGSASTTTDCCCSLWYLATGAKRCAEQQNPNAYTHTHTHNTQYTHQNTRRSSSKKVVAPTNNQNGIMEKSLLNDATSQDDTPTPGYMLNEISRENDIFWKDPINLIFMFCRCHNCKLSSMRSIARFHH